jgi:periplasmic protein TonB
VNVDRVLDHRRHRGAAAKPAAAWLWSAFLHAFVAVALWFVPGLFAAPPEPIEYVPVTIFSPAILGIEEPPPPPPPKPAPPKPLPPEPEPEPEPIDKDTMVLAEKEKRVEKQEPPPQRPPPPPPPAMPPPKRTGSPFGATLGAATSKARVGVEDPNFTYGYYLDRVVAVISDNWVRPPVGVEQAVLYFRIQKDGTITDLRLAEPSGSEVFDRAALRAVESSSPLPPLPSSYKRPSLGINLIVK